LVVVATVVLLAVLLVVVAVVRFEVADVLTFEACVVVAVCKVVVADGPGTHCE